MVVFLSLETERICKIVSMVMFVPGQHYAHVSGTLQAQSSSAYSSSTDEPGGIPRNTVYGAGSGAFLQVCRVKGSMDFSCALDGSGESVKLIRRNSASSSVGATPFVKSIAEVATTISYCCAQRWLATSWFGGDSVVVVVVVVVVVYYFTLHGKLAILPNIMKAMTSSKKSQK